MALLSRTGLDANGRTAALIYCHRCGGVGTDDTTLIAVRSVQRVAACLSINSSKIIACPEDIQTFTRSSNAPVEEFGKWRDRTSQKEAEKT